MREYLFKGWDSLKHQIKVKDFIVDIDLAASTPQFSLYPSWGYAPNSLL